LKNRKKEKIDKQVKPTKNSFSTTISFDFIKTVFSKIGSVLPKTESVLSKFQSDRFYENRIGFVEISIHVADCLHSFQD
jgi:hypothetical protein